MSSSCCLLQLLLPSETFDGSIQHQVLLHSDFRPQDVKLRADAQVLTNGCHVILDAQPVDDGITWKMNGIWRGGGQKGLHKCKVRAL